MIMKELALGHFLLGNKKGFNYKKVQNMARIVIKQAGSKAN